MIFAKCISSFEVICIKIPVKGPSLDAIECQVSLRTSFKLMVIKLFLFKLKRKDVFFSPSLFTGKYRQVSKNPEQPYVRLTSKSKIARTKVLISRHLLCDSIQLKF